MKTTNIPNFFSDKPVFGLDIGPSSLKVLQIHPDYHTVPKTTKKSQPPTGKHLPKIVGYGYTTFDRAAITDGVVVKPEVVAEAAQHLLQQQLVGELSTRRVAVAIPAYRTFTRSLQLPKLRPQEIADAIALEAEQYISAPLADLYLDYEVISETADHTNLFLVAVPKTIVDSYLELTRIMGLEAVLIEPTLSSTGRLFGLDPQNDVPTMIIDFGSRSADISIYDHHVLVTGTVSAGGEIFTNLIKDKLDVTQAEAQLIKTKYGLGASKRQAEIQAALSPTFNQLVKEIRRMIRYYEERYGAERPISQIVTIGGGANMPGLSDYLTDVMRVAVRHGDPWQYFDFKGLQPPTAADRPMYATVAGLSLTNPHEVFRR